MKAFRFTTRGANAPLAVFAALLLITPQASAAIIDTFINVQGGDPDTVFVIGTGTSSVDFTITPAVVDPIGSSRRLEVGQFTGGESVTLNIDGTSGEAALTSTVGATSTWRIIYGVTVPGGLHFDATAGGTDAFRLTITSASPSLEYRISAFGYTASGTSNGAAYQPLSAGIIDVPFSTFSNFGSINFADLNQIDIQVRDAGLSHGGTAAVTQFETVPEPASGVLLAVAGAGLLLRRRRAG